MASMLPLMSLVLMMMGATVNASAPFDLLIFAQTWPATTCIEWQERSSKNTCNLPKPRWTVHGIWPTEEGTVGPSFCNRSSRFDASRVRPILAELEEHWTNVHANSGEYSFWRHEWEKHGTCAASIAEIDTEIEYFSKGIELNEKFDLYSWLSSAGIVPGNSYSWRQIFEAVKSNLNGIRPAIQCQKDDELNVKTLAQIFICLDKRFQPMDCDQIKGGLNQFCPRQQASILYPKMNRASNANSGSFVGKVALFVALVMAGFCLWRLYEWWRLRNLFRGYEDI